MELSPYGFCLLLGSTGMVLLATLGHLGRSRDPASHGIDHQLGGPHGSAGGHHVHHGDVAHDVAAALGSKARAAGPGKIWALLSPRAIFTMLVGAGAAGSIARAHLAEPWPLFCAALAALTFELGIVGPLANWLLRFASQPARTLETTLLDRAVASSRFDARGHGMVTLELDGHVVQLLGTLSEPDRARGVVVRVGDLLTVEAVDPERNRCTVSHQQVGAAHALERKCS